MAGTREPGTFFNRLKPQPNKTLFSTFSRSFRNFMRFQLPCAFSLHEQNDSWKDSMVDTSILLFGGCRRGWKLFAMEKPMTSSHLRQHHCTGKMWDGSCSSPNWSWRRLQGSIRWLGWLQDSRCWHWMDWSGNWHLYKSLSRSRPQWVVSYIFLYLGYHYHTFLIVLWHTSSI